MEEKDTKNKSEKQGSFKDTLNLPHTDFPIRPNAAENDPKMLDRWEQEKLFETSFECNKGSEKFILHDGPPYANGNIHLGHAYNKVLKDIVTKAQRMSGKQVPVTPGWDCHGLPIELKVTQENPGLPPVELKKKCREYAAHWVDVQRDEFKKLGVLMNWDHPYLTMDRHYESSIIKAFGVCFERDYISRKKKTVPWCPSCETVLATAEIEYQDRKDPSIYVRFPLTAETINKALPELAGKEVSLLVWTTTPWTLPLNRAVCLKPKTEYQVIDVNGQLVVLAKELVDKVTQLIGVDKKVIATLSAEQFAHGKVHHPFIDGLITPILLEPFVSTEDGTACVHSAPGCGPEDYEIGIRHGLEIFSPLSADGKYTQGIEPKELEGMRVTDAQGWVIKTLSDNNHLMFKHSITHSYPHCWRCHGGLIFRATDQWFLELAKEGLRENALRAIDDNISFVPKRSSGFLRATVSSRLEWCISRQRVWGVPIPALICLDCGYGFTSKKIIDVVAAGIAKEGVEYWDTVSLLRLALLAQNEDRSSDQASQEADLRTRSKEIKCPKCASTNLKKETDILDVWFDSGVSHFAVLYHSKELAYPADIYLEGLDQHRGWFQSSLLTSLILEQEPCTRSIVTHGFTVDAQGKKMSKSLGNVVSPDEIIKKLGTDGLRLWASSIDIEGDAIVSHELLGNVSEVYRRVRNTCRFLLSNLYDFDIDNDGVDIKDMLALDRYALVQLLEVDQKIRASYENVEFTTVFHVLGDYCAAKLSSFYLDIIKDRLYTDYPTDKKRRSAQTVCWHILDMLTRLMAPVLSFTAESISDHYQKNKQCSIHLQPFANNQPLLDRLIAVLAPEAQAKVENYLSKGQTDLWTASDALSAYEKRWEVIKAIRSTILKTLEGLRAQGIIKHSLEARVNILINTKAKDMAVLQELQEELQATGQSMEDFLKELLIVSHVDYDEIEDDQDTDDLEDSDEEYEELEQTDVDGVLAAASKAAGDKCPRCWQWEATDHEYRLCHRCQHVVARLRSGGVV